MVVETYIDNGTQWAFNFSVDNPPFYTKSITFPSLDYEGTISVKIPVWITNNGTT